MRLLCSLLLLAVVLCKSVLFEKSSAVLTIPMTLYHGIQKFREYETQSKLLKINPILNDKLSKVWIIDIVGMSRIYASSPDWDHLHSLFGEQKMSITLYGKNIPSSYCYATYDNIDLRCSNEAYHLSGSSKQRIPDFVFFTNADVYDVETASTIAYLLDRNIPSLLTSPEDVWCGFPQTKDASPPKAVFPQHHPYEPREEHFSEKDYDNKCIGLRELLSFYGARFLTPFQMNRNPFSTVHDDIFHLAREEKGQLAEEEDMGPDGYPLPPPSVLDANRGRRDEFDGLNVFFTLIRGRKTRYSIGWKSGRAFCRARFIRDFAFNQLMGNRQYHEEFKAMMLIADEVESEQRHVDEDEEDFNVMARKILASIRDGMRKKDEYRIEHRSVVEENIVHIDPVIAHSESVHSVEATETSEQEAKKEDMKRRQQVKKRRRRDIRDEL